MKCLVPIIWLLLAADLILVACAPEGARHISRYQPTGLPPVMPSDDFTAYIDATRARVIAVNEAAGTPLDPIEVAAVSPFEFRPRRGQARCNQGTVADYDKGVLLIHGLNDTPYSMWDLAGRFSKACYMVRALLLPGHGTVPGDLLEVGLPEWREAVARAISSFRGQVDRLVIVGFDIGANLALDAGMNPSLPPELELDGIVMLAPGFLYEPPSFAPAAAEPGGDALWGDVFERRDGLRYNSVAKPSIAAANTLGGEQFAREAPLHIPLFIVASADDAVADPNRVREWFCRQPTTPRRLIWYTRYPCRPMPACQCTVRSRDPNLDRRTSCVVNRSAAHNLDFNRDPRELTRSIPKNCERGDRLRANDGILDLAHIALLAAPDNPRYGASSGRRDCLHYSWERETPEGQVCVGDREGEGVHYLRFGETSSGNIQSYILRRLTYNPDFDFMATAILDFLEKTD
ncbi:MAG: alpha/beta hydrolase [Geminicoccaceae bacterium]